MKFDSSDILAILRAFNQAGDEHMPRHVESIQKTKPHDKNVLIRCKLSGTQYAILIDNLAEDDEAYIYSQAIEAGDHRNYRLLVNPLDGELLTYGLPYKGKDCYVLIDEPREKRLDVALVERFGKESRSTYQKMIIAGQVQVNEIVATSPKQPVTPEDEITINAAVQEFAAQPYEILYEDGHVLVINKPAGMLTHAKGAIAEEFTAADIIKPHTAYKADTNRPGIIHRLDRDTSGVLLMVKTDEAAHMLQRQFSNRTVKKTYTAVISGTPKQPKALLDLPIERNPSVPSTFRVGANGKPAQTVYEVSHTTNDGLHSLVLLRPRTGRTHQLRVHMQYLGTPIVGDVVYGIESADRMYLHASSLEVTLPGGKRMCFTAPLPASFTQAMES